MITYLATRALRWITGLLLVLFVSYAMMFYGAGDPVRRMFIDLREGSMTVSDEMIEKIRAKYGLDQPFPVQFANYVKNLLQGDFGNSIREKRAVLTMIQVRLPISMQIGLVATIIAALIGIPLGVIAALKHNQWIDTLVVGMTVFLNAVPLFVTGPLLLVLLVLVLQVMDVPFGWKGIFNTQVILPVAVMALGPLPTIVRQTRAAMLEVITDDYIRTARAKGLPERIVILRHMLRPVMIPVVTSLGMIMMSLVNGALFVELIFNIPGFGKLTVQGLQQVDYPIIMAVVLIGTLIVMVSNLLVDLLYPLLDPRITRS
ncbi:MAG: ABC transporter permease [Caldilineaceae bacterium]|jgi:ABC-type dipeptide/oligopeptide/nickel transport system permease component